MSARALSTATSTSLLVEVAAPDSELDAAWARADAALRGLSPSRAALDAAASRVVESLFDPRARLTRLLLGESLDSVPSATVQTAAEALDPASAVVVVSRP
ncbi:MAG: hypothetical protein U0271_25585 [Polyangiaceae bacterium]